jgi:hypothetical protein
MNVQFKIGPQSLTGTTGLICYSGGVLDPETCLNPQIRGVLADSHGVRSKCGLFGAQDESLLDICCGERGKAPRRL